MARQPTPVGTWGEIWVVELPPRRTRDGREIARHEARAKFRDETGRSRLVRKVASSPTKASNLLRAKLKNLSDEVKGGEITPDTRFAHICDLWLADLKRRYALSGKSPQTPRLYEGYVRNWIRPALGELQGREVRAKGCDDLIQRGREQSYDTAKSLRAALSGICAYAVRYGAMSENPVKSTSRLERGTDKKEARALTLEERGRMLHDLESYAAGKSEDSKGRTLGRRSQVWQDLPVVMLAALSTGVRLGELIALDGADVDPSAPTVAVCHHIVRVPGEGLRRMEGRKGGEPDLLLAVPQWSVPMWRRRKLQSGGGPLFPAWNGSWADPSNISKRIREALNDTGWDWVTSHVWRKTVATVLDEAGLETTAIADQLGNTPKIVEQHYRAKRVANRAAADALGGMIAESEEPR